MRSIWRIIVIAIVCGFALSVFGIAMGASRELYLDKKGLHIDNADEITISEPNLEKFTGIEIDTRFIDVEFITSGSYGIKAAGHGVEWDWGIKDGTLSVASRRINSIRIFSLNFSDGKQDYLQVFIPKGAEFDTVSIKTASGDVKLGSFSSLSTTIISSFGDVALSDATCDQLQVDISSGNFKAASLDARNFGYSSRFGDSSFDGVSADRLTANSDSGNIKFSNCIFGDIYAKNAFGDITGSGVATSKADMHSKSGNISLIGDFAGQSVFSSKFGDISLKTLKPKEECSYDISASFGGIKLDGVAMSENQRLTNEAPSGNNLKITASSGDISVEFAR
ncbi:MAG: DUF4097 domain-containing protein [Eubacteriaceae bacterium]|nr:DUF4097 domain-containing protein [Eubacteriaceae bacterium]